MSEAVARSGERGRVWRARDALVASDPGLNRLIGALQAMIGIAVTVGVVYAFVQWTHILWAALPAGRAATAQEAATLAAQHHGITVLTILVGGVVAMLSALGVSETAVRAEALTMVLMPIPMLAMMALAIEMVPHHALGVVLLAVVVGVGTYLRGFARRFGPRMVLFGLMLFIGYFFGFLSNGELQEGQLGWIAVIIWLAALVNFLLKAVLWRWVDRGRMRRTLRGFLARCRGVLAESVTVFDASAEERSRAGRGLHRRLRRMNETALVIDGSLGESAPLPFGSSALDAHDELFEAERLIQSIARIAEFLGAASLSPRLRTELRGWLAHVSDGQSAQARAEVRAFASGPLDDELAATDRPVRVGVRRLALAIEQWAALLEMWPRRREQAVQGDEPFRSDVTLFSGDLPGSRFVSAQAAAPGTDRRGALLARLHLDGSAQQAIRITLAVGVAAAIGSLLSEPRYYWAVIAVFIIFFGANTAGEQILKAGYRVLGTTVGIFAGSLLAHAIGRTPWSIAVIIAALGFGIYFTKVIYALMVVGITVMVSLLYEQLEEYSNHVLVLRLEETAIGATVATLAAMLIFPVGTRAATRVAALGHLALLGALLGDVTDRLRGQGSPTSLTGASLALDAANQQLAAAASPLTHSPFRRDHLEHNLGLFAQLAHVSANLVADVELEPVLETAEATTVLEALRVVRGAVTEIEHRIGGGEAGPLPRIDDGNSASAANDLHRLTPHLERLDDTLIELGSNLASR